MLQCETCGNDLTGRQRKYCCRRCHNTSGNKKFQDYAAQQKRAHDRKRELIALKGGCCSVCGYKKNMAALEFHHTDGTKEFGLDSRRLSNCSMKRLLAELEKCILLCANCHREEHNPDYML